MSQEVAATHREGPERERGPAQLRSRGLLSGGHHYREALTEGLEPRRGSSQRRDSVSQPPGSCQGSTCWPGSGWSGAQGRPGEAGKAGGIPQGAHAPRPAGTGATAEVGVPERASSEGAGSTGGINTQTLSSCWGSAGRSVFAGTLLRADGHSGGPSRAARSGLCSGFLNHPQAVRAPLPTPCPVCLSLQHLGGSQGPPVPASRSACPPLAAWASSHHLVGLLDRGLHTSGLID